MTMIAIFILAALKRSLAQSIMMQDDAPQLKDEANKGE